MKKRIFRTVIILLVLVLLAAAGLRLLGHRSGICVSSARYIESAQGHLLLLNGSPISMSGHEKIFQNLTTGDQVLVAHGWIAETYPGQSKAYLCMKFAEGTETDIPSDVLQNLTEMGWVLCD